MTSYVIFGTGRVGPNIAALVENLGHSAQLVTRAQSADMVFCETAISKADIVAGAVPDDALASWRDRFKSVTGNRPMIHFSGASVIDGLHGYHPLYSFPKNVLRAEQLRSIAFACPKDAPALTEIFPKALNPTFQLHDSDRARYHALAVLSGNLPAYLWNQVSSALSEYANMAPDVIMRSYLESILERFLESPENSLTGPLARKDAKTVHSNLNALQDDPSLKPFYDTFKDVLWPDYPDQPKDNP